VILLDVQKIVDADQLFVADFGLFLSCNDPRLAHLSNCRLEAGDVWQPVPVFPSQRDLELTLENFLLLESGQISLARRYYGQFSLHLDLRDFPFDHQELAIELVPMGHGPEDVRWVFNEEVSGRSQQLSIPDWEVGAGSHSMETMKLAQGRVFPLFSYRLPVRRYSDYYLTKVIIPLALIVLMSYLVFYIDPEMLPSQVGLSTASVLTLIAFQFSLGYYLPRVAYLTRLDRFLMGSTVLVFTALALAILTGGLARREKQDRARSIERTMRWLFPTAFMVVVVWAFWF
jgi:hypothetical protein